MGHDVGAPLLRARGVVVEYSGVRALDGVDLEVRAGEVLALVGENGAGKSTLVKVLGGGVRPKAGGVELAGEALPLGDPVATRARGVAVVWQETTLAPELDVAANVFLGAERARRGLLDERGMRAEAAALLERLGARVDPRARVGSLGVGLKQLVEVARALAGDARLVVLDEPSTALSNEEVGRLFEAVRGLRARGIGVVYISHRLEEVFALSDRTAVLRDGAAVHAGPTAELDRRALIRHMVGRELAEEFPPRPAPPASAEDGREVVLELRGLSAGARFRDVSLRLRRGEILGVAGLAGAGRSSLGLALAGALAPTAGELRLAGELVRFRHPGDARAAGVAYLPEDRKRQAVFAELSVAENVALPHLGSFRGPGPLLDRGAARRAAAEAARSFRVVAPSLAAPLRALSGGNQQKALFARALLAPEGHGGARCMVLDEPTRGVDVGARAEIYRIVRELVDGGLAVLMISSDLVELLGMCDRIAVLCEGRLAGVLDGRGATQEAVMELATRRSA